MSRLLALYIGRQVIQGVLLALLVLVGIGTLLDFIAELKYLSRDHVSITDIIQVVAYSVPALVYETFSPAVLIGSLLALGNMASNSELIAMRAAGVSKAQITAMVALTGIVLVAFIVAIGELILPAAEIGKERTKAKIRWNIETPELGNIWLKEGEQFIHITKVVDANTLEDVHIYSLDEKKINTVLKARKAIKHEGRWQLSDIEQIKTMQGVVQFANVADTSFDWQFDLGLLSVLDDKSQTLSIKSLYQYIDYIEANQLDASRYRMAFWLKLLAPLTVMVMLLLALPFVFGSLRSMSNGNLIVIGLVIGLVYYITSGIASNLGYLYGLPPFINALAPPIIFVLMALFLMLKQKF